MGAPPPIPPLGVAGRLSIQEMSLLFPPQIKKLQKFSVVRAGRDMRVAESIA